MAIYKKFFYLFLVLFCVNANANQYKVDPAHSVILFRVSHLGIGEIVGRFNDISGSIVYDKERPRSTTVSTQINLASVDTSNKKLDKFIRGPKLLNSNRHLVAVFNSDNYQPSNKKLYGFLQFHGIKKQIVLKVQKLGEGIDLWDKRRIAYRGTTELDRRDFGMKSVLAPESFKVKIEVIIEAILD